MSISTYKEDMKKRNGQFYTTRYEYILEGMPKPPVGARVIEPFAGKGDLLKWLGDYKEVEAYDIEPKAQGIIQRDTLRNPIDYLDSWVVTNPPYLARNKCDEKELFDRYNANDLYKCFLYSMKGASGGVLILPSGFFLSPRDMDERCRDIFFTRYRVCKVKYFEETVFDDTTTTVVAISFERAQQESEPQQEVEWIFMPSGERRVFTMSRKNGWIIGGEIYSLSTPSGIQIRRHVEGQPLRKNEQQTHLTLQALDTGLDSGRIKLEYKPGYVYPAKDCSRTYATLRIIGRVLSENEQRRLADCFNSFIEKKRLETHSLFLPQYRESKLYARKRIPFELAYTIVLHQLKNDLIETE